MPSREFRFDNEGATFKISVDGFESSWTHYTGIATVDVIGEFQGDTEPTTHHYFGASAYWAGVFPTEVVLEWTEVEP